MESLLDLRDVQLRGLKLQGNLIMHFLIKYALRVAVFLHLDMLKGANLCLVSSTHLHVLLLYLLLLSRALLQRGKELLSMLFKLLLQLPFPLLLLLLLHSFPFCSPFLDV